MPFNFGSRDKGKGKAKVPQKYFVPRVDDPNKKGHHFHSGSEASAAAQLMPTPPGAGKKRYPKVHNNTEEQYPKTGGPYYEHPADPKFPADKQNSKGKAIVGGAAYDPGFKRIITNDRKELQGLSIHPTSSRTKYERTTEVYSVPSRSDPKHSESYKTFPIRNTSPMRTAETLKAPSKSPGYKPSYGGLYPNSYPPASKPPKKGPTPAYITQSGSNSQRSSYGDIRKKKY